MASSELGSQVQTAIDDAGVVADTPQEIYNELRKLGRSEGNMKTVLDAVQTATGKCWVSRKRVRSDALRLVLEGVSFS